MFSEYLAYKFENYLDNDSTFELVTPAHLPTGKYVAFYKNDSTLLALEVTNYNGEKNGTQREFYLNGNQKISQDFVNGEMNGEYIYYYRFPASQNCRYEQRKHGLLNGAYRLYCPNGQKNTIGQGKNGVEYGTWLRWDCDNGKLIFKWRYKNGKMVFSKKFRN